MKRLGILGVCLLAMAASVAGGAQQPAAPDRLRMHLPGRP